MNNKYIDVNSPIVQKEVERLTKGLSSDQDKLAALFYFVRDEIKFGFHPEVDYLTGADIILRGVGQCNNKTILLHTLCKAAGFETRIHFSGIKKEIQKGLFTGLMYRMLPKEVSHSWLEIKWDNQWIAIDNYINDLAFYQSGKRHLKSLRWDTGFSVSCSSGESSPELDLNSRRFVQMDAVVGDHGIYDDPEIYFTSSNYQNNPKGYKIWAYRMCLKSINRKIIDMRKEMK